LHLGKIASFFFKLFLCALEDLEKSLKTHYGLFPLYIFSLGVPEALHVRDVRNVSMYYMSSCTKRLHVRNVFVYETLHVYETCEASSCTTCLHVGKVFMCETSSCTRSAKRLHVREVRNAFMYETCFVLISSQFCLANVENSTDEISSP